MRRIELRLATAEDAPFLFAWRNDPDTRRSSVATTPVTWQDHLAWLKGVVADPNRELYVAYLNGEAVGTTRLDFGDEALISVTVAPEHRGKGLALPLIRAACATARGRRVVAEIRPENSPSIRAFERAGFQFRGERGGLLRYAFDPVEQAE